MNDLLDTELQIPSPVQSQPLNPSLHSDPRAVHAKAIKSLANADRSTFNRLITLYSKSNLTSYSQRVFNQIPFPNVVSWTSLISAHANTFHSLHHFVSMLRHPILPNQRTLPPLFRTCASLGCLWFGLSLHCLSVKLLLYEQPYSGSALIHFYSKCGLPCEARRVLDEMPEVDEVCCAAAVVGLAQNSRPIDALAVFSDMRSRGITSTMYSITGALRAVAQMAALEQCKIIHGHALVTGADSDVFVGSALIDAYGKAGLIMDARMVFDENLAVMNVVGWNAMLAAYAQQGDKNLVLSLFRSMEAQELEPDEYSFLAILSSLCNAGMDREAEEWLSRMRVNYGIEPTLEHYTCLVGAMGRAGRLEDAEKLAKTMPFEPDAAVWRALLSASAHHGVADMASFAAKKLLELNPNDDSAYVISANVLSSRGRWPEVAEVRKMMKDRRVRKERGRSWIELQGQLHVFLAGDKRHDRSKEIYKKLVELMEEIEKMGYVPEWEEMLHVAGEKEKKEALWYHSEKLALAFAVVSGAPEGKPIRIVKNLRICRDCHKAFKYLSTVLKREIIVRDVNRYHRFYYGTCSCGDIW